jgi:hypothetical protein
VCWKKSNRKLALVAQEHPEYLRELLPLDDLKDCGSGEGDRRMFRSRRSVADLLAARLPDEDVIEGSCGESCEAFIHLKEASA